MIDSNGGLPLDPSAPDVASDTGSNAPEMTVSELSTRLKRTVEDAYSFIRVRGELGRVTVAKSGHMYCDLKDDKSVLNTIMWKGSVSRLGFRPEEGLEVVAEGKLSTYPGRSNYQLIADRMKPAGVGALMALLEERKKKFAAEGLFDQDRKQPLPFLPETIGVVTSPTGAVIRDILHRIADRFPVRVYVWPVLVQGEFAAEQVAQGIRGFNAISPKARKIIRPDLIIVARGGGSVEDLWPFNDEQIIRAVSESEIPLISAVGHETDTTLIDYVADRRAPTPTGAAEIAVPVRTELFDRVEMLGFRARRSLSRGVENGQMRVRAAIGRMPKPETLIQSQRQRLDYASEKLGNSLKGVVAHTRRRLDKAEARLQPVALQREIVRRRTQVDTAAMRGGVAMKRLVADAGGQIAGLSRRYSLRDPRRNLMRQEERLNTVFTQVSAAMKYAVERKQQKLDAQARLLSSVSHENVLARGFVIVQKMTGELVRRASEVESAERLKLQFADDERRVTADAIDPLAKPRIVVRRSSDSSKQGGADAPAQATESDAPRERPRIVPPKDGGGGQGTLF